MRVPNLALMLLVGACASNDPDVDHLKERVDGLERDVAALKVAEGARTADAATKALCPAAKVKAHDAWELVCGADAFQHSYYMDNGYHRRFNACTRAADAASGGALKARDAAEAAAKFNKPPGLDLSDAIAASEAAFQACKDVDP